MHVTAMRHMTEPELREYFRSLSGAIEDCLPAGPSRKGRALFALIVFDDPGVAQYVSNANRQDMIRALRETADRIEKREMIEREPFSRGEAS